MPKEINCDCGATVRGVHDDDVVARAQDHQEKAHPEQEPKTREELLQMAQKSAA